MHEFSQVNTGNFRLKYSFKLKKRLKSGAFLTKQLTHQEIEHALFLHRKLHPQLQSHLAQPYL